MSNDREIPRLDELMCFNVYALNLALGRMYQTAFGETGFTYPKFVALLALRDNGAMSLSELAARVGTEPNTLSPMIKKMSEFSLVERVRDENDERRILLSLLPYGETVLAEAVDVLHEIWADLDLASDDIGAASRTLTMLRQKVETVKPTRVMTIPEKKKT